MPQRDSYNVSSLGAYIHVYICIFMCIDIYRCSHLSVFERGTPSPPRPSGFRA